MQRKPGGYRKPTEQQREHSRISKDEFGKWFQQFWNIGGESTRNHPAPFPLELAHRIVRMFSFVGDTVLDPFVGTGTTMLAAIKNDRNSVGIDVDQNYLDYAASRLQVAVSELFSDAELSLCDHNGVSITVQTE
jgi:site-specific DNA-methyltransferase (adenine-specific)